MNGINVPCPFLTYGRNTEAYGNEASAGLLSRSGYSTNFPIKGKVPTYSSYFRDFLWDINVSDYIVSRVSPVLPIYVLFI